MDKKEFEKTHGVYTHAFLVSFKIEGLSLTNHLYSLLPKISANIVIANVPPNVLTANGYRGKLTPINSSEVFLNGLALEQIFICHKGIDTESRTHISEEAIISMARFYIAGLGS